MRGSDVDFILCLDFDGVICDSAVECFVSSWLAYHGLENGGPPDVLPLDLYARFLDLRPFIRSGPDYVLIQKMLNETVELGTQGEFDRYIAEVGDQGMSRLAAAFYEKRELLLGKHRRLWLSLNPLFPHMKRQLSLHYGNERVMIVSSKRSDFVVEILASNGIPFPPERIFLTDHTPKLEVVENIVRRTNPERAYLVDDQIDHLRPNSSKKIYPMLPLWGYIKREWIHAAEGIALIEPEDLEKLFRGL